LRAVVYQDNNFYFGGVKTFTNFNNETTLEVTNYHYCKPRRKSYIEAMEDAKALKASMETNQH
jgi:hypothetical protein